MTDELLGKSALFFHLVTLDSDLATLAIQNTIEKLNSTQAEAAGASVFDDYRLIKLIKVCLSEWRRVRPFHRKEQVQYISTLDLNWPDHLDLNPWKEFQKIAPENELVAVTWVHVLGVPESTLGHCLSVSEGTIRYRVANGLALLGRLNRPNITPIQFS